MKPIQIKSIPTAIICACFILLSIDPVFSLEQDSSQNNPIGKVIAIRGKVIAISDDSTQRSLVLKAPIFLKEKIKTKNGRLQMMFKDNTLVTLGRNSEIQITKYLWEPGNSNSAMESRVEEGSFRIMGGAITRIAPDNFKTDAPSGTIGIRGSMYAGRVDGNSLFVLFQGGKGIYVQNSAGMVDITRPGFGTRIGNNLEPPEKPKKIELDELQELEHLLASAPDEETREPAQQTESGEPGYSEPQTATQARDTDPVAEADNTASSDDPDREPVGEPSDPAENSGEVATVTKGPDSEPAPATEEPSTEFGNTLDEAPPLEEGSVVSESPSLETLSDTGSLINDATLGSTQNSLDEAMTPVGTEQEILFLLLNQGFDETPTKPTTIPSTGIWSYKGDMKNALKSEDHTHQMKFIVNWQNERIIAFEDFYSGEGGIGFAFGEVDASGNIINMKVLGSDAGPDMGGVMALSGSETFGQFYGTSPGGLGLAMGGYDYHIQDQSIQQAWSDIIAAKLESKSAASFSGSETWNGFFIGVSEDMANPGTNRRVFYNTSNTGFSLSINKDAGTFSGSLSGPDFNPSGQTVNVSGIGGAPTNSAYINDKTIAAEISGADVSPLATGQKTYGNFLVTANEPMLSQYTTWGYWEIAYDETGSPGGDYHLHVPGSRWIAGLLNATTISGSFTGVYEGGARGVMFDNSNPAGQMKDLAGGKTTLNINFGASPSITGNISFDGSIDFNGSINSNDAISLAIETTPSPATFNLTTGIFNAEIDGATTSYVNGAFYGPDVTRTSNNIPGPAAVGGSFSAEMPGEIQYHGIFAGNLK